MNTAYRNINEVIIPASDMTLAELLRKAEERSASRTKEYLNLSGLDLHNVDLSRLDLRHAILHNTNLRGANLQDSLLSHANICDADLSYANLDYATCNFANISRSSLCGATVRNTVFRYTLFDLVDFYNIAIHNTNFTYSAFRKSYITATDIANFSYATFDECAVIFTENTSLYSCGMIIDTPIRGYKKCDTNGNGPTIVTLEIPRGAIVFSINGSKCRTNKAIVLSIDGDGINEAYSFHDQEFVYRVGDELVIDDFDLRYNVECGTGIHFFLTKGEAEHYY